MAETYKTQQEIQAIRRKKRTDDETGAAVTALLIVGAIVGGIVYMRNRKQSTAGVSGIDYFISTQDIDVMFAENVNTEMFFETNDFPEYESNLRTLRLNLEDYVDNAKYFGEYDPDKSFVVGMKNGCIVNVGEYDPTKILRTVKPGFVENGSYNFIIYFDCGYTYFWFNGWTGLKQLQEYTGWFDMDLYSDWI